MHGCFVCHDGHCVFPGFYNFLCTDFFCCGSVVLAAGLIPGITGLIPAQAHFFLAPARAAPRMPRIFRAQIFS